MKIVHAAESGHWYAPDGSPMYEIRGANGKLRPTTLRDARKLGLLPSVTTIIKCAAAPGLENWKQNQVLLAALTLPRNSGENDESFCARVIHDSQEQSRKARDRGTDIHAAVQGHFEGQSPAPEFWPHVKAVADEVNALGSGWIAERSFGHVMGFGGKCDLHSQSWVIDFKTKEFGPDDELKTWDEHAMQLAAYRRGLGIADAKAAIVYVSTTVPGCVRLLEIDEADLHRGWGMFSALLAYWQAKSNYWPSMCQEAA